LHRPPPNYGLGLWITRAEGVSAKVSGVHR